MASSVKRKLEDATDETWSTVTDPWRDLTAATAATENVSASVLFGSQVAGITAPSRKVRRTAAFVAWCLPDVVMVSATNAADRPTPSQEEFGAEGLDSIRAIADEIRREFIAPSLREPQRQEEFWRVNFARCHSMIQKLHVAIHATGAVPAELIAAYAMHIVEEVIPTKHLLASAGIVKEISAAHRAFVDSISLARTAKALLERNGLKENVDRSLSTSISRVLIGLMSIDSDEFISSSLLRWNAFQNLRDGVWGAYHRASDLFYSLLSPDVSLFAKEGHLSEFIETAVILAREAFSKIGINYIACDTADGLHIVIDASIPLTIEEATESYFRFCEAWTRSVPWPQRDQIVLLHHAEQ